MNSREGQFLESLRATFKAEAIEHLESIGSSLMLLEKTVALEEKQKLIESVFRAAHSLKGAARAVDFAAVESICEALEDIFAAWKRRESLPSTPALDVVHKSLDAVSRVINDPQERSDQALLLHRRALQTLIKPIAPAVGSTEIASAETGSPATTQGISQIEIKKSAIPETVRIGVAKLDARLLEAEEMLAAKMLTGQRESELHELLDSLDEWKKAWAKVQPVVRTLRQSPGPELRDVVEFFDWHHHHLQSLETRIANLTRAATQDRMLVGKLVDDLLENSKKLLMLPLSTISNFLQKLARDLCRDQGKQAEFVAIGKDVEIDKRVLEAMKDPLIHIIRNCVDHGLETPKKRQQQGKPDLAKITFAVTPLNDGRVEFAVTDDGDGIDTDNVKSSAVKQGLITKAEADRISSAEALALVFRADVSTSPLITELSGRGLGLAIVREQTEKLGGTVSIESTRRVGTTIRMTLPITLRTFRGILVEAANQLFVVPTAQVQRVARFRPEEVQTVEGREVLVLNDRAVSLTHLSAVLELPDAEKNGDAQTSNPVVVMGTADEQIAFAVDAVINEQELLVKRFGKPLSRVRNISGATLLGSGQVAPILRVSDLIKSARKTTRRTTGLIKGEESTEESKSILLVEDSVTSRMLLKSILEAAGYQVKTAVDGLDAFTILRTEPFDLVVSDVEMPRLNGFDLTARIRREKKLEELPVVLITALETREDRERGIDVGASAYLVKSSFDQSNLLEIVRRLARNT